MASTTSTLWASSSFSPSSSSSSPPSLASSVAIASLNEDDFNDAFPIDIVMDSIAAAPLSLQYAFSKDSAEQENNKERDEEEPGMLSGLLVAPVHSSSCPLPSPSSSSL